MTHRERDERPEEPVLVLGAGGFVGARLMDAFAHRGVEALALRSGPGGMIDPASGMLSSPAALPARVGSVVFLAQSPHYRAAHGHAAHLLRVNTCLALEVAERAVEAGARRIVYASSGTVYADSFLPLDESAPLRRDDWYALSKIHAEEALAPLRSATEVCVLRLFGVYGPGQRGKLVSNLARRIAAGDPVSLARSPDAPADDEGLRLSLAYVDDVVAVICRVLEGGGPEVMNVAGALPVSIRGLSEMLARYLGVEARFESAARPRTGDLIADVGLMHRSFGLAPTALETGLERTIAHAG